ncbi:hypothetical protein FOPG_18398, partial [Fusarium oxysporum f. sp. conglutinans race 2 54008]
DFLSCFFPLNGNTFLCGIFRHEESILPTFFDTCWMRARDGFTKHHFRLPNAGRRGRTCLGNASRSCALGINCMYVIRSEFMLMLMY